MSSRQLDQQQKTPDGRTCWASSVVRTVGDCWLNADASGKWRQKLSLVVLASLHEYTELLLDSFWNIKPVKLSVHQSWQTMIKFPRITNRMCSSVQHSLWPICYILRCPSVDCITVIHTERHKSMDKCRSRFRVKWLLDVLKLSRPEKSRCTNVADVLNETQVGRDGDTENTDMLASCDIVFSKMQAWITATQ